MRTEVLVRLLAAELTPVRRLHGVNARTMLWASLSLLCVGLGSYALGARPDFPRKLADSAYLAESAALLVLFACSARSAFHLSIPGLERGVLTRILPVPVLLAWVLLVAKRFAFEFDPGFAAIAGTGGLACLWRMIGLSLVPAAAAFVLLSKAAPRKRGWTGFLTFLSAGSLAILGTQVVCAKDEPGHVLVWHVGPVVLAAVLGIGAGRSLLRRATIR